MHTFGLDLSLTSTGLAELRGNKISARTITTTATKDATYLNQSRRIVHISEQIKAHLDPAANLVAIEGPSFNSISASVWERAALFYRTIHEVDKLGLEILIVPPRSLKLWATGSAAASKQAVADGVSALFPHPLGSTSFDAFDAAALAMMAAHRLGACYPGRARARALGGCQRLAGASR